MSGICIFGGGEGEREKLREREVRKWSSGRRGLRRESRAREERREEKRRRQTEGTDTETKNL